MKKKDIPLHQFAFETKNTDGPAEDFLEKTAPLIGYIVHSFNTLEETLNDAVCKLIYDDNDAKGLQVIYRRSYADKVDLLKRLLNDVQIACEKEVPIFEKFISDLEEAGRLRNQVVHADWESAYEDGYTLCKLKINKNGIQHEYVQFTLASLKRILKFINKTSKMFEQYDDVIRELLYS